MSGKVLKGNTLLDDQAKAINSSPEDKAWIAEIQVNDASELEELLDAEAYKKTIAE